MENNIDNKTSVKNLNVSESNLATLNHYKTKQNFKEKIIKNSFKIKNINNKFSPNKIYRIKDSFSWDKIEKKNIEYNKLTNSDGHILYYKDNQLSHKKIVEGNVQAYIFYKSNKAVKKISKIRNDKYIDYKYVKYGKLKESTLYRYANGHLIKKASFVFKNSHKCSSSIYFFKNDIVSKIERSTYYADNTKQTNTSLNFLSNKTKIVFKEFSELNKRIKKHEFIFKNDVLISLEAEHIDRNILNVSAINDGKFFDTKIIENSKYGKYTRVYKIPATQLNEEFAIQEKDYDDISPILKSSAELIEIF